MLTEKQRDVINALAFASMNACEAARMLHIHKNTIQYHIDTIRKMTGLDPRDFFDLQELYKLTEE